MSALLELDRVDAGYGTTPVVRGISIALARGEVVGLLGPNGAGKSTLLRAAAGVLPTRAGVVRLDGVALASLTRRDIARKLAWLPQAQGTELPYSAREIVAMGRLPHLGALEPPRAADRAAIEEAIGATGIEALADRPFPALSEGEKQRVLLARCLAQQPRVLLLDEPTASLDVRHAWSLLRVVRDRARAGAAVLAAVHDLALAARACDRVIVIDGGEIVSEGPPAEALSAAVIARTFGMRARVDHEDGGLAVTVLGPSDEPG
ncbi:MAG TPA: ABC transporter ATP-binding protein [Sandaracinaceae bacterium]